MNCIFPVRNRDCKNKKTKWYEVTPTGIGWRLCKVHTKICGFRTPSVRREK